MTDDEIREALDWTLSKPPTGGAPKLPSTQRTVETWRRLPCSTNWPNRSSPSHPTFSMLMALFGTTTWTPSSTAKCSGRSVSTRGPKQPRSLLRRASPTGQRERKLRERRGRGPPARASNVPDAAVGEELSHGQDPRRDGGVVGDLLGQATQRTIRSSRRSPRVIYQGGSGHGRANQGAFDAQHRTACRCEYCH